MQSRTVEETNRFIWSASISCWVGLCRMGVFPSGKDNSAYHEITTRRECFIDEGAPTYRGLATTINAVSTRSSPCVLVFNEQKTVSPLADENRRDNKQAFADLALRDRIPNHNWTDAVTNLCDLCSSYPEQTFETGALLLVQGERSGRLFIMIEGDVCVVRDGIEVAAVNSPGAVFGELSLLLDKPHMATVMARAPTRVRIIDSGDAFLRSAPEVIFEVARVLAARLHMLTSYLGDLKQQFADRDADHFVMVDAIIDCMTQHQQATATTLGSKREPGIPPST